jgi:hypothetical protein
LAIVSERGVPYFGKVKVFFLSTRQGQQSLTDSCTQFLNYGTLSFCTMSMKILLHQILEVWDKWNILKCTYISITLAILVEFLVISIFHENKIPTVDMKVLGYFNFR